MLFTQLAHIPSSAPLSDIYSKFAIENGSDNAGIVSLGSLGVNDKKLGANKYIVNDVDATKSSS